jgi:diguanylate cyclase (GGDEF)-like protein
VKKWAWAVFVVAGSVSAVRGVPGTAVEVTGGPLLGALALLAMVSGIHRHHQRGSRPWQVGRADAWALIVVGMSLVVAGQVFLGTRGYVTLRPLPALLMLAAYPFLAGGVLRLIYICDPRSAPDSVLVAGIGAMAAGLPAFVLWFGPEVQQSLGSGRAITAVALPTFDLFLLLLVARLRRVATSLPPTVFLLLGSFAFLLFAHTSMAINVQALGVVSMDEARPWLALAYVFAAGAAWHPSMSRLFDPLTVFDGRLSGGHIALLASAQLLAPGLMAVGAVRGQDLDVPSMVVSSALLALLVTGHLVRIVQARAAVEHRVHHDELTGLLRREAFEGRVEVAVAQAQERGHSGAIMFLDLDRFKTVNDSLGHGVGNQLLQYVARRLRRCVREGDIVARNGGDEFTVLLPMLHDPSDAKIVAEKILAAFVEPFSLGKKTLFVTSSIGIAVFPRDGSDPDTLLKNADAAMYRAKERGRNNAQDYTADLNARADERLDLENELHLALERNELVVYYQPKVDTHTGRIRGVEALVRWQHPRLGLLGPNAFIPLAEESGQIAKLGRWVMEQACAQAVAWQEAGFESITMAVNVSARQVQMERLEDMVAAVLRRTGLSPSMLELELTESLVHSGDKAAQTLADLVEMGVNCSVDDFGVGYAGLSYLNHLPINGIKIDKSFVSQISSAVGDAAIVIGIIAMAHKLGLEVIAEGVETPEQLEFLRRHGCDQIQGFLFSKPVPAAEVEKMLAADAPAQEYVTS